MLRIMLNEPLRTYSKALRTSSACSATSPPNFWHSCRYSLKLPPTMSWSNSKKDGARSENQKLHSLSVAHTHTTNVIILSSIHQLVHAHTENLMSVSMLSSHFALTHTNPEIDSTLAATLDITFSVKREINTEKIQRTSHFVQRIFFYRRRFRFGRLLRIGRIISTFTTRVLCS